MRVGLKNPSLTRPKGNKIFWFDTETTGLDPKKHGIVQLACLVEINREIVEEKLFYMNPHNKEISQEAIDVHGISREEIETFPLSHQVKKEIESLICHYIDKFDKKDKFFVAAYNANFDVNMLLQLWKDCGDKWFFSLFHGGAYIDPLALVAMMQSRNLFPTLENRKLETVAKEVGVSLENAHDALADIQATREVYHKLWNILGRSFMTGKTHVKETLYTAPKKVVDKETVKEYNENNIGEQDFLDALEEE